MSIRFSNRVVYLENECDADDAEPLLIWLREHPKGKVNLKNCQQLHTAVLQVLMAIGPGVTVMPLDQSLARWLPLWEKNDKKL